jgi:deoxyribonuclease-4
MYEMLIRKKALKIQERLGMRIGVMDGISKIPVAKTTEQALEVIRELYKIGLKAFVLPKELFYGIDTSTDLYKAKYGDLLRIKDLAKKYSIELALRHPSLGDQPDETLRIFCNIASIMDCRTFIIRPTFYAQMPQDQALKLVVYKINEIMTSIGSDIKLGIETTGRMNEVGSLEDVIDIVKRTTGTQPVLNWGQIHARGVGALRSQADFKSIMDTVRRNIGSGCLQNAYFIFSGASYGPSGFIRGAPLDRSDMKLEYLIHEAMGLGARGTLIIDDPGKENYILKNMENIGDMVR